MQLIFKTEAIADFKIKMTEIEEPLEDKIIKNGTIEDIKAIVCNGNKENILEQNNIIENETGEVPEVLLEKVPNVSPNKISLEYDSVKISPDKSITLKDSATENTNKNNESVSSSKDQEILEITVSEILGKEKSVLPLNENQSAEEPNPKTYIQESENKVLLSEHQESQKPGEIQNLDGDSKSNEMVSNGTEKMETSQKEEMIDDSYKTEIAAPLTKVKSIEGVSENQFISSNEEKEVSETEKNNDNQQQFVTIDKEVVTENNRTEQDSSAPKSNCENSTDATQFIDTGHVKDYEEHDCNENEGRVSIADVDQQDDIRSQKDIIVEQSFETENSKLTVNTEDQTNVTEDFKTEDISGRVEQSDSVNDLSVKKDTDVSNVLEEFTCVSENTDANNTEVMDVDIDETEKLRPIQLETCDDVIDGKNVPLSQEITQKAISTEKEEFVAVDDLSSQEKLDSIKMKLMNSGQEIIPKEKEDVMITEDTSLEDKPASKEETQIKPEPKVKLVENEELIAVSNDISESQEEAQMMIATIPAKMELVNEDAVSHDKSESNEESLRSTGQNIASVEKDEVMVVDEDCSVDNSKSQDEAQIKTAEECIPDEKEVVTCVKNSVSEDEPVSNKEAKKTAEHEEVSAGKDEIIIVDKSSSGDKVESNEESLDKTGETAITKEKEDIVIVEDSNTKDKSTESQANASETKQRKQSIYKLSNTLNILSDDEDESESPQIKKNVEQQKQCINIEDDDDIMLIEEDASNKDSNSSLDINSKHDSANENKELHSKIASQVGEDNAKEKEVATPSEEKDKSNDRVSPTPKVYSKLVTVEPSQEIAEPPSLNTKTTDKLLHEHFLKLSKRKVADMTREELEEFCILKIVESVMDRSSLSEIKSRLKNMTQTLEEYRKKAVSLSKQNRDLQVVLKSVQEQLKKNPKGPVTPMKITRSVGMQVLMSDKGVRRKVQALTTVPVNVQSAPPPSKIMRVVTTSQRPQKQNTAQNIPVPRLVPANNMTTVRPQVVQQTIPVPVATKATTTVPNGVRFTPPKADKRTFNSMATVDLTDDEQQPPRKFTAVSPVAAVRLVQPVNAPVPRHAVNNPRKVYIPISSPQNPNIRSPQGLMLKVGVNNGPRPRFSAPVRAQNAVRVRAAAIRHPAPLPDAPKQHQPSKWKALPPAPDLKLNKIDNGIVISWKIEGYQEDSYEAIASFQLYAYQETSTPPSTSLWKKIGDVKALPLPMACTLTQFQAGFKYYFAVRAVDAKSRLGPFSLPGGIVLLSKTD